MGCPCTYETPPNIHLRGFCHDTLVEHESYTTAQSASVPSNIMMVGFKGAQIEYDSSAGQWILSDPRRNVTARTRASQISFALGKHNWTISGDAHHCFEGKDYNLEMKLTRCNYFWDTLYALVNASDHGKGIRLTITMRRKIMSEMMTTYFPSLLLMMFTYATTFFKSFFFEAALSVNLTTMLVMTTIFISKMEGLPPTSNIKMIDIWLILCQLVPFAQVVLLTAMEFLREEKQETEFRRNRVSTGRTDKGKPREQRTV